MKIHNIAIILIYIIQINIHCEENEELTIEQKLKRIYKGIIKGFQFNFPLKKLDDCMTVQQYQFSYFQKANDLMRKQEDFILLSNALYSWLVMAKQIPFNIQNCQFLPTSKTKAETLLNEFGPRFSFTIKEGLYIFRNPTYFWEQSYKALQNFDDGKFYEYGEVIGETLKRVSLADSQALTTKKNLDEINTNTFRDINIYRLFDGLLEGLTKNIDMSPKVNCIASQIGSRAGISVIEIIIAIYQYKNFPAIKKGFKDLAKSLINDLADSMMSCGCPTEPTQTVQQIKDAITHRSSFEKSGILEATFHRQQLHEQYQWLLYAFNNDNWAWLGFTIGRGLRNQILKQF